uniref:Beta-flanking protein n=1 Tax=Kwoniella bestiolae CBS 10118 TaxID=1296100 RepID=A0A1B9G504_9TREE|nr:beta-flanking protein [Kwoniella bestiolae CBS 10118]OCF26117.1 beta-flanking protein [Kwoniella bestiolae CBS 10118]
MDFLKKVAQEKLSDAFNGDDDNKQQGGYNNNNNNNQQGGYGGNQGGYGGNNNQQVGGYGGQGGYGGNQDQVPGGYGGGNEGGYGGNQGGYGGQQGGFGGGNNNQYGNTGGEQYNRPHGQGGAGGFGGGVPSINENTAVNAANQYASNGNENSSLFSTAMSFLGGMNKDDNDVDEDKVQRQHDQAYNQGNTGGMSANAIGSAAAMQALKMFTSGSGGGAAASSGGGDMQSKIIGMAMSEAAKLFDQSGGAAQGNKQDAVTSAGQTIMKLLIKSQFSGTTGGGNSGGLSGLMSMASKFM